MASVQRINASCGRNDCPGCTQGLAGFMPHNFVCCFVGNHDDLYNRRETVYYAFIDQLDYECRHYGWNYEDVIRGIFPSDAVRERVMHLVSEYHRLDAAETQNHG